MKYTDKYWEDVKRVTETIPNYESLFGKKILITGGTGMICSSVAEILFYLNREKQAGIKIVLAGRNKERMADRFKDFVEGQDYIFLEYDATENKILDVKVDLIIHGASNANPVVYSAQPVETMLANIVGLQCLLQLAVATKVERVLYVSSSEVYGNKEEFRPYEENDYGFVDILNPRASYPCSKRAAETLCAAYQDQYQLDTVIVRPGHIYGPTITNSDSRASAQFTRSAVKGEDIVMKSAGTQLRSYCYTLDCASALLAVLVNGEKGNAYNISNKDSICSISDIAKALAKVAGREVIYECATEQDKKGYNLMSNSALNAKKLEDLGWKACFDLEEGTARTIEILKES